MSDTYATSKSKSERVVALYRLEYIVRLNVKTFGLSSKIGYINDIVLKGNYWRSLQKGEHFICRIDKLLKNEPFGLGRFANFVHSDSALRASIVFLEIPYTESTCMITPFNHTICLLFMTYKQYIYSYDTFVNFIFDYPI